MGQPVPKQFMDMGGRKVIEYPIATFCSHPAISEVAVVIHPEWRGELEALVAANDWPRLTKIIDGGTERYQSSVNALKAYADYPDDTNLLLHDAARPMVSADIVGRVVAALATHEAAGVAVPATDTVWEVDPAAGTASIRCIPDRRAMWLAQTPQAFRLPLLREAWRRALQDPHLYATDDCSVVRRYVPEAPIAVVEGAPCNRKLTVAEDIPVIEQYIGK